VRQDSVPGRAATCEAPMASDVLRHIHSSGFVEGYVGPHNALGTNATMHWSSGTSPRAPVVPKPRVLAAPKVQLFEVNAQTGMGDRLVIVGSNVALGSWDPRNGVLMDTDPTSYPIWHAWCAGCLPACEFKFAIIRSDGSVEWEGNDNRTLQPLTNRVAAIFGVAGEVARTCTSDAALLAQRQAHQVPVLLPPPLAQNDAANAQEAARPRHVHAVLPAPPVPHAASPLTIPPPIGIGPSLVPYEPGPPGSVESSPCVSRRSLSLSHISSHGSLSSATALASSMAYTSNYGMPATAARAGEGLQRNLSSLSHSSLRRSGSRVSFSQNLVEQGA